MNNTKTTRKPFAVYFALCGFEFYIERTQYDYPQWFIRGPHEDGEWMYLLFNHRITVSKKMERKAAAIA